MMSENSTQPVEIYSNQVRVHLNPFDIAIDFGLLDPTSEDMATIALVARVRVSPQMAKALIQLLTQLVTSYEANVGEIPSVPINGDDKGPMSHEDD